MVEKLKNFHLKRFTLAWEGFKEDLMCIRGNGNNYKQISSGKHSNNSPAFFDMKRQTTHPTNSHYWLPRYGIISQIFPEMKGIPEEWTLHFPAVVDFPSSKKKSILDNYFFF